MPMKDPSHPGEVLKHACLKPLKLSVTRAAQGLGVTQRELSDLVNCRASVSVDMALLSFQGVRVHAGDMARYATGLRPVAGAR